jgi:cbb3-type cytochrome oxidase subunit 3
MFVLLFIVLFLPIVMLVALRTAKRSKEAQDKRIVAYRKSPESRILKLND